VRNLSRKCPICGEELEEKRVTEYETGRKGWLFKCKKCGKMWLQWGEKKDKGAGVEEIKPIYKG